MQRYLPFILCMILLAACAPQTPVPTAVPPTATSAPTAVPTPAPCISDAWEAIGQIDFDQPTISVMFRDPSFGIATDLDGGIHYTEDGGQTWTMAQDAGNSRVALDIDADTIWHIAFGGSLFRSTDGGHAWEHLSQLPHSGHVEYVSFSDVSNGWAFSTEVQGFFYTTVDGGKTWSKLPQPEKMGRVASLQLRTPQEGYLFDVTGSLFITRDGGQTWTARSIALPEGLTIPNQNHSAALRFMDENNGLVALSLSGGGSSKVYVLRTADGGATWSEEALPVSIGMFFLTRDGSLLTHVDLLDHAKFTLLCAPGSELNGHQ